MNEITTNLRFKSGIYIITNINNGKRYIGSSKDLYNRLHEHLHNLKFGKAHNKHFQSSWNKHGENSFLYGILELCEADNRFIREQFYLTNIKPEYNFSKNVIANTGTSPSQEVKKQISETLKKKYSSGEIKAYKQEHAWIPSNIYNIYTLKLCAKCNCIADACRLLKVKARESATIEHTIFKDTYCITNKQFDTETQLKNHICENVLTCISSNGKYLVSEDPLGNITYHRTIKECAEVSGSTRSTLNKHGDANKEKPYIVKKTNFKIYYLNDFIPYKEEAVPLEESRELLLGNIGKDCDVNAEINLAIS